ncbi:hypothetical protein [Nocardiopsis composta]|uniref:Uncharacterized protein n=1 Tax=Nocardiopsis composta TaxID=157465 RepID=A0A7W8QPV2_9ACTN|nr:hypothetical protein [Nocardiopsis composta]MBB5433698.1 hypothetical protein [Nocardiopsis composta]
MGAEGTGGGVGHRSAPVGRAVAAAALVGLGWPAVLLLPATGMLMPFTDKPHAWDGGETAAVIVPSLGAPALEVLPVAWLLRRLRVPSPLAVAATGLLLACPVAVGLVAVASAELRPDLTALTAVLASVTGAVTFALVVRHSFVRPRLRAIALAGAVVLAVGAPTVLLWPVAEEVEETAADFDAFPGTMVVMDREGWEMTEAAAVGDSYLEITYRSTGKNPRTLQVTGYADPDYDDFGDPCADLERVGCEDKGAAVLKHSDTGPELFTEYGGTPVTVQAPTWLPDAREADLLAAAEHLREPTPAEREELRDAALWEQVDRGLPG